jgi:exonuclease III
MAGYGAIWHGQKSWNGVAILARGQPLELSNQLGGFDLSEYDLDGPLPDIPERQFALSGLGNTRN